MAARLLLDTFTTIEQVRAHAPSLLPDTPTLGEDESVDAYKHRLFEAIRARILWQFANAHSLEGLIYELLVLTEAKPTDSPLVQAVMDIQRDASRELFVQILGSEGSAVLRELDGLADK